MLKASLAAVTLLLATPGVASSPVPGGKGSDVATPINDTREDILAAAGNAEGVAARAATIIEINNADRPLFGLPPVRFIPPAPVASQASFAAVPSALAVSTGSQFPFYLLGLIGVPFLLPGGDGGDFGAPDLGATPPGVPGGPAEGPPPVEVPVIPEPSTWLMLLLGFGATGAAIRKSRSSAAVTA